MSKMIPAVLAVVLAAGALTPVLMANAADAAPPSASTVSISNASSETQKVGYSFGYLMGKGNREAINDLDMNAFISGFKTGYADQKATLTEDEIRTTLMAYKQRREAEEMKEIQKMGAENIQKGTVFLAENAKKAGIKTTASGLQYEVLKDGSGVNPKATDQVQVHYEGKLLDGTVFDSSVARGEPATFPLNGVISGWTEGVQLMKEGAKYRFYIPSALAYGETGAGSIPPNSVLIFDVELLKVNP